jgi:hypothetical protein
VGVELNNSETHFAFQVLLLHRWRLLLAALLGIGLAGAYVVIADKMYTVDLVAVPARFDQSGDGLSVTQALGGLSALAGAGSGLSDEVREALAILRSRSLIEAFIQEEHLLPVLFEGKWDASENSWKDQEDVPSLWDGYRRFSGDVISVSVNSSQGIISLRVTWKESAIAAQWANKLLAQANDRIRKRVIDEAAGNIDFLRGELEATSLLEVRQSIFSLVEAQIRRIMLANTRPDYAFRVVDPAQKKDVEDYDYPRAAILLPVGAIVAVAIYLLIVLVAIVFSSPASISIEPESQ